MSYLQNEIRKMEESGEIPTRLAVLDLEGTVLGYQVDTFWGLSKDPQESKVHSLKTSDPKGAIAENLVHFFSESSRGSVSGAKFWVQGYLEDGVIVSVQSLSNKNFGEELLRYRVSKNGDEYVIQP